MAHGDQQRLCQPQRQRDRPDQRDSQQEAAPRRRLEQTQERDRGGQRGADQDRDNPVAVRDRKGDQLGRFLDLEILRRREQDLEDKYNKDEGTYGPEATAPSR